MDLWVPPICGSILSKICSLNFSHSANSELHPLTPQSNKIVVCCFNSNCPIPHRLGSSLREKAIINVDFTQYVSLQILSAFGHFPVPSNNCLSVFNCSSVFFCFCFFKLQPEFRIVIYGYLCPEIVQATPPLPKSELSKVLFYGR